MVFQPGQSGNPAGRKPTGKPTGKRRLRLSLVNLKDPKDVNGLAIVATVAAERDAPIHMRLQAGIILAQYQATKPARRISKPLDIPVSESVEQATATIAKIGALAAADQIGLDEARDLVDFQKAYIEARTGTDIEAQMVELRETIQKLTASSRALDVTVFGGLPALPGTRIAGMRRPENGGDSEPEGES